MCGDQNTKICEKQDMKVYYQFMKFLIKLVINETGQSNGATTAITATHKKGK